MQFKPLRDQVDFLRRVFWIAGIPVFVLLFVIGVLAWVTTEFTVQGFTRDIATLGDLPFYAGSVSTLGLILWGATAGMCVLTYAVLRSHHRSRLVQFIGWGGALTVVLLIDDAYLLHEHVFPRYLGVDGSILFGTYAVAGVAYLASYRRVFFRTNYSLFLLGVLAFAVSVVADYSLELFFRETGFLMMMEDGSKLVGVVAWTAYFADTCRIALKDRLDRKNDRSARPEERAARVRVG